MNRISPPVGVQARPVATPGTLVRMATSFSNRRGPRMAGSSAPSMRMRSALPFRDAHGDVAADRADQPLEVAHAGLARVVADDGADRVVVDLALLGRQAGGLELALEQIAPRDLQLLVLGVAGQLDHLHAVAHRARDGVEHVGGAR